MANERPTRPTLQQRWLGFIRTGETALVVGPVIGALSCGGDMTIAIILLAAAAVVASISIAAEPTWSTSLKAILAAATVFVMICIGALIYLHYRDQELGLLFECGPIAGPVKYPADGRLNTVDLYKTGEGMSVVEGDPGSDYKSGKSMSYEAIRCVVTNYSNNPIIRSAITLRLVYRKPVIANVPRPPPGEITLDRPRTISFPKIDPGPTNPFILYIFNRTSDWVQVSLPEQVSIERLGEMTWKDAPLTLIGPKALDLRPDISSSPNQQ